MDLSIIIPTYNRCHTLKKCLKHLEEQSCPLSAFEVIVVDDGSTDDTVKELKAYNGPLILKVLQQAHAGQGHARNLALQDARGEIVLFLGDDILLEEKAIEEHLRLHHESDEENIGVLGKIEWDTQLPLTPYMKWMTNGSSIFGKFGGHQFAYEKLEHGQTPDFNFFYTSNLSLKRSFLGKNPFDPQFSHYGWEDIELGYRLEKEKGLRLLYAKNAIGYHDHLVTEEDLKKRMILIGKSAHLIDRKHPELKKVPPPFKKIIFQLLSNPVSLTLLRGFNAITGKRTRALYFYALSKKYFLQGVNSGYNRAN